MREPWGHGGRGGRTGEAKAKVMGWVALGVLILVAGVLVLRAGMPGRRAHAVVARNGLLSEVHVLAFVASMAFGFAMVINGLVGLAG